LRQRHLNVLIAVCRAYNFQNGLSHVSQEKLAEWTGYSRQYVNAVVKDLIEFGYIKVEREGKWSGGHFRCHIYKVLYEPAATAPSVPQNYKAGDDHVHSGVDTAGVDTGVDTAKSTPVWTHSESLYPDKNSSDSDTTEVQSNQALKMNGNIAPPSAHTQADIVATKIRAIGSWEAQQRQEAHKRIAEKITREGAWQEFMDLPNDESVLERAIAVEIRRKGAGIKYIRKSIENHRS
jgi:hypothetical protein